jgi:adenine-specific DNA-methyltransferase
MKNISLETAFAQVQVLINDFEAGIEHYLSPSYQEAEVRKEYIDKFFTALGWDVNHDYQKNPFEQEVKIEKAQRQQGALGQKRADYAFFLAPNYKQVQFFVEAKKPSRTLLENKDDYFQTAKYGWNANTKVSILTDFEELVIIDCRFPPDFDTILQTKIKYYKYTDFIDFDTI